jgi:hypothetical protein
MFIMITNGDPGSVWACFNEIDIICEAHSHVCQVVSDHWRDVLPEYPTDDFRASMELVVLKVEEGVSTVVQLPYEKWLKEFKEAEADLDQEEDFKERKNKTIIDALTHFMGPGYRDRDWFPSDDHLKDEEILATIENIKTRGYV